MKKNLTNVKTVVIKIGSSVIASHGNHLDEAVMYQIVRQITDVLKRNIKVVIVSSGAIASGMAHIGLRHRPKLLPMQQACAAIGQNHLINVYSKLFARHKHKVAQILLTQDGLEDRKRYLNAKNTLLKLLQLNVVPIINENDTVSTEEIRFGDNDRLSGLVATLIDANLLILLSDVNGLYDKSSKKIDVVEDITSHVESLINPVKSTTTVGGMSAKLQTAKMVTSCGIPMVIASGRVKDSILRILENKGEGTLFSPKAYALASKKHWIAYTSRPKGAIVVDNGARDALTKGAKSLLSSGVVTVKGKFDTGDTIRIVTSSGSEFAKGVTNYSSGEIIKIKGLKTQQIEEVLGYKHYDEIVHRDNLVILQ